MENDTWYDGSDVASPIRDVSSAEDCNVLCQINTRCNFFNYDSNLNKCRLKRNKARSRPRVGEKKFNFLLCEINVVHRVKLALQLPKFEFCWKGCDFEIRAISYWESQLTLQKSGSAI